MTQTGFLRRRDEHGAEVVEVALRGQAITDLPFLNKGTAFSDEERDRLGLRGLLPPRIATIEQQLERVMANFHAKNSPLEKYIHLISLLDRNETLYYRVLAENLEALLPIVYTPTVGQACQEFSRIFRRRRGLYVTLEDLGRVDRVLANWPYDDVGVVVVTDGERILGLGDLGANGMGIPIGKSSLYVAGAGIHPLRTLPLCLDTGTNNRALLEDPLYIGRPQPRERGARYDRLIDELISAIQRRFPRAIVQFEDFGKINAFRLLDRLRDRGRIFNDDIQGTAAVTLAAVCSALRETGESLEAQRVFIAGGGSAGVGIARLLAKAQVWMFDSKGLITADRSGLSPEQQPLVRDEAPGSLLDVARRVRPTVLIGVSGQRGLFSRELIETMAGPRPMIFPLSNPTSSAECDPADARAWTGGRAIVAAGSPFPQTEQCNNLYIFPGVGLGVLASGAERIPDSMFVVAARRLSELAAPGRLFPELSAIRSVSREIAIAVAREALRLGVAPELDDAALAARIESEVWEPAYPRLIPV